MLCCQDCSLETDETFTTVLFLDTVAQQRTQALQNYAQQQMKKMQAKSFRKRQDEIGNKENMCHDNRTSIGSNRKNTGKQFNTMKKYKDNFLSGRKDPDECSTGRFKPPTQIRYSLTRQSQGRKTMDSKTTSFGSICSRSSLTEQFSKKVEIKDLQEELETLREQQMTLLRDKLQKQYLYKRQMSKITGLKQTLRRSSKQRQSELYELKGLFAKNKANKQRK